MEQVETLDHSPSRGFGEHFLLFLPLLHWLLPLLIPSKYWSIPGLSPQTSLLSLHTLPRYFNHFHGFKIISSALTISMNSIFLHQTPTRHLGCLNGISKWSKPIADMSPTFWNLLFLWCLSKGKLIVLVAQVKNCGIILDNFLPHTTSNPSANTTVSTFKVYPESSNFSLTSPLPLLSKTPLTCS